MERWNGFRSILAPPLPGGINNSWNPSARWRIPRSDAAWLQKPSGIPGELRQLLYGKRRGVYRILFEVRDNNVFILRVRHSAQALLDPNEI
jgi:plasmid stabilization system protein ParE